MTYGPGLGTGVRLAWTDLPERLRAAVAEWAGSPVASVTPRVGGFSPGAAVSVRCADGSAWFVKAVSAGQNPDTPRMYRDEVRANAWLPPHPALPALRWTYDEDGWVALLFDHVEAGTPALPWRPADVDALLAAVASVHDALTPGAAEAPALAEVFGAD